MPKYKFRAETASDVYRLGEILGFRVEAMSLRRPKADFADVEVELETWLTLEQLRDTMRRVKDGHVMLQTVQLPESYTGERDYTLE